MTKDEILYQMAVDHGYGDTSTVGNIDEDFWMNISLEGMAEYFAEKLSKAGEVYRTSDGQAVVDGDTVYVIGSCGVESAQVDGKHTTYMMFSSMIPVEYSFSTKELAQADWAR